MTDRPYVVMPVPGITRITTPTPFPGLDHVHVYVARGPEGGLVVIDTSVPMDDAYERIVTGIRALDRDLSDIERIYLTHAHPDHIGNAARLQDASGAEVVCHPIALRAMEAMQTPDRWNDFATMYAEHGREPQPVESMGGFAIPLPSDIRTVEQDDVEAFGDLEWEIHWTPGHEHGHIVFHAHAVGLMLVGDTVLNTITPHIGYYFDPPDPLGQFMDSLERIAALDPAWLLAGHGRVMDTGSDRAMSIHSHHRQRLRRTVEILRRKGPLHAMDVARELFGGNLMVFAERLAMSETLSHLEYLRLRDQLTREKVDGVWLYAAVS